MVAPDEEGVASELEELVLLGMGRVGGPLWMVSFSCCSTFFADFMGVAHFLSLRPFPPLGGVGVDWVLVVADEGALLVCSSDIT